MTKLEERPEDLERALEDLPIFPLPGAVLFPRALMPLHIFEPRYRAMIEHCMATHRALGVALIVDPSEVDADAGGEPRIARVAGVGIIVEHQALPDGRSNVLLRGRARVALSETPKSSPFRRAKATLLPDLFTVVPNADRTALIAAATSFANELHKRDDFSFTLPTHAGIETIADLSAAHLVADAATRQSLLEERDVAKRVRRVIAELALQHRALVGGGASTLN